MYGQGSIEACAATIAGVEKGQVLVFYDVYYYHKVPLSLISDEKCWEAGLFLKGKKRTLSIEQPHCREIGKLEFHHGKVAFEYNPVEKTAFATRLTSTYMSTQMYHYRYRCGDIDHPHHNTHVQQFSENQNANKFTVCFQGSWSQNHDVEDRV